MTQTLFTRDDTFFGICQGLGEDLGIHPDLLRLALVGPLFFFPVATIGGYFAAGLVVLAVRLLVPVRPQSAPSATEAADVPVAEEPAFALAA